MEISTENSQKLPLNIKNLIFTSVAVLSISLKIIYDWDKLIQFSPDVLGGLFLEIAPLIIIQMLAFLTKKKDFSNTSLKINFQKTNQKTSSQNATIWLNNALLRFLLIILLAFLITAIYNSSAVFATGFLISFLNTFFIWEGVHRFVQMLLKYYPHYAQTPKRLIIQFTGITVYAFVVSLAVGSFGKTFLLVNYEENSILLGFMIALAPTLTITWLYETVFFFKSWKINTQKLEEMDKNKEILTFW